MEEVSQRSAAFTYLVEENLQKEKTREITFTELKMSAYLKENKSTSVLKLYLTQELGY